MLVVLLLDVLHALLSTQLSTSHRIPCPEVTALLSVLAHVPHPFRLQLDMFFSCMLLAMHFSPAVGPRFRAVAALLTFQHPAASTKESEERNFVVDSGASMHMVS